MKIKTIIHTTPELFDAAVNEYLVDGWQLTTRGIRPAGGSVVKLYAELILPDSPTEQIKPDLFKYAEALRQECLCHEFCGDCPLDHVCGCTYPGSWLPTVEEEVR